MKQQFSELMNPKYIASLTDDSKYAVSPRSGFHKALQREILISLGSRI